MSIAGASAPALASAPPDALLREGYFARKLPELPRTQLARWVEVSNGLPFAALTELVISVECLGNDLEAAAETLRELDRHMPSSDQFGGVNGEPVAEQENPVERPIPF